VDGCGLPVNPLIPPKAIVRDGRNGRPVYIANAVAGSRVGLPAVSPCVRGLNRSIELGFV
jgi:hypothetical protein